MFQKLASEMKSMLYTEESSGVQKAIKLSAVGGTLYAATNLGSQLLGKISAYGSHMVGKGECTALGYGLHEALYERINDLNGDVSRIFGNAVSKDVADWLLTKGSSILGDINEGRDYLVNKCGESQQFLDSLGVLRQNIVDSLALYGLTPQEVPIFGIPETYLILAGVVGGTIAAAKLGQRYFGDIFHKPQQAKQTSEEDVARTLKESREPPERRFLQSGSQIS